MLSSSHAKGYIFENIFLEATSYFYGCTHKNHQSETELYNFLLFSNSRKNTADEDIPLHPGLDTTIRFLPEEKEVY